ncbi:MAG: 16S rRNA (cytosine(1402)-N(4))-methyltransferase RsmH, partial [Chitinophagaceae bacterium]
IYVDCTFGGGGHSRAILEKLDSNGLLIAFDQDADAVQNIPEDPRVVFIPQNFRHIGRFLKLKNIGSVNGILADLGVSSHQFNEPGRGFSTRFDGSLDMRMNNKQSKTAADILNTYPEEKLHRLFEQFGEVTNSKTLARTIVTARAISPFTTIAQFRQALQAIVKGNPNKYFAQVFQALRIEVNEEFDALRELLQQVPDLLAPGGRIAVITFHSGEDRIVKNFFKNGTFEEVEEDVFGRKQKSPLKVITKKPVMAGDKELKENSRSRSAKLRVAEKV